MRKSLLSSTSIVSLNFTKPQIVTHPTKLAFYYTRVFETLTRQFKARIDAALLHEPLTFREDTFLSAHPAETVLSGDDGWNTLKAYLEAIEERMADIARRHSPAYWLHLYRRIAPFLHSGHVGKNDDNTVLLVRRTTELAMLKHGDLQRSDDLGRISEVQFESFLGSWYAQCAISDLGSNQAALAEFEMLQARGDRCVLADFTPFDFVAAYQLEGLAYEHWKTAAAMRSIGKGAVAVIDADERWIVFKEENVHPLLFAIYDERIGTSSDISTRSGAWLSRVDRKLLASDLLYFTYNPNPEPVDIPFWSDQAGDFRETKFAPNFWFGQIDLSEFLIAHAHLATSFRAKHGFSLQAFLDTLQAIGYVASIPPGNYVETNKVEFRRAILDSLTNQLARGYRLLGCSPNALASDILAFDADAGSGQLDPGSVKAIIKFLTLDEESRDLIGLWAGSKRPMIIVQTTDAIVIDLSAIIPILNNLFYGIRDPRGEKGDVFEDAARETWTAAGLDIVHDGELKFLDNTEREADAIIRSGNTLILVECVAIERPVDWEWSKPRVVASRIASIAEKTEQAKSLIARLMEEPVGSNFDFSWATEFDWRVCSVFTEFAWSFDDDDFDASGTARVMRPDEIVNWLNAGTRPAPSSAKYIETARTEVKN